MDLNNLIELSTINSMGLHYEDTWGNRKSISPENLAGMLSCLGYDVHNLDQEIATKSIKLQVKGIEALTISFDTSKFSFTLSLDEEIEVERLKIIIFKECGNTVEVPLSHSSVCIEEQSGRFDSNIVSYRVTVEKFIKHGYHTIKLICDGQVLANGTSHLIIAPNKCFVPSCLESGDNLWGTTVQLYSARSKTNWGVGDFSDLKYILEQTASFGGDFVGINPIHSLFVSDSTKVSPYSPSSRKWLNVIYIDVTSVPGFEVSEAVQELYNSTAFQTKLASVRANEFVDYKSVMDLKLSVLTLLYNEFKSRAQDSVDVLRFGEFVKENRDALWSHATFDAISFALKNTEQYQDWRAWPEELRVPTSNTVSEWATDNFESVEFWAFLQWLAFEQLADAQETAKARGMRIGLYKDIAVGSDRSGFDLWEAPSIHVDTVSLGCPPDFFCPSGQNWGFPPFSPEALREQGYRPYADLIAANMKACGALRIDHILGILRQWWVPNNTTADRGVFVNLPVEELLAVISIESHRNQCLVIGEALGTVPEGILQTLKDKEIFSYRVSWLETDQHSEYYHPSEYEKKAITSISTHDFAPIIGYWQGVDLELGEKAGLFSNPEDLEALRINRDTCRQKMLQMISNSSSTGGADQYNFVDEEELKAMNYRFQALMAETSSQLYAVQIEDLLNMRTPANLPGTYDEYENWRRKLSNEIEDCFSNQAVIDHLLHIQEVRRGL
ncbi:4-alpha-glucanotransferase [Vibrio sp. WXL103]|uniref:4-alpha-glucanotransferase n=1 Tax=Vibrio sp. WXL103 TaxID=3450710 RepID=UPI003EC6B98F